MTRAKENNAGLLWPILIFLLLFATGVVRCQEATPTPPHSKLHQDTIEQQEEIRFMFITVTEKKDNLVYFYRQGKKSIEVSMLFWDVQSVFKDPNAKPPYQYKGCFAALICLKHAYIYWLQRNPCSDSTGSFFFTDK